MPSLDREAAPIAHPSPGETVDKLEGNDVTAAKETVVGWKHVTPAKAGVQCWNISVFNPDPTLDPGFRRGDVQTETWFQRMSTVSKAGVQCGG